ncbi:phage major head subunit gpT-like protein [Ruminiclostridium sufflavum DSM 19573]|uniref:Phage major head subunit gpT-like protein n=1 Tax=Ruminiclostridium sufflavum DSM 19573 TaxID=1121337 RepID=A0A318Y3X6_9FIRM|nr:Mu-like prophage major head subunit gpT family protein [Ruminiclostridium sufflavum]PYG86731.1 phage major head subunit gpT-like protein [Ruminiclostridium sufflavum DSM 19573]
MIVNQQSLRGIYTGFNIIFAKAFDETKPLYDRVATVVPSITGEESYKWLGTIPMMREWIGDRQIKSLTASDYTIKNKDFEVTVGVPRNDIEDDRIGLYSPSIQSLGQSAALHPDELVFVLLPGGFTNKCYDGMPFFSDAHKVGKKTISNKGTAKLSPESYAAARSAIMSMTDEHGKPLKIIPDLLVTGPALEGESRKILLADQIDGTTNVLKGTAEPLVVPDLAGYDSMWFLLCTKKPVKPLIYQERQKPKFVTMVADNDENVFMRKEFLYGADSRGNAGYAFWQMAYGSDGSAQ